MEPVIPGTPSTADAKPVRCPICGRLLFEAAGRRDLIVEFCGRCETTIHIRGEDVIALRSPKQS